jgi:phosphoglycerate dehydrogenase-like enzyme
VTGAARPRVAVLNDYQRVARTAADWTDVERRADVEVHDRAFRDEDDAAAALAGCAVVCAMRERQPFPASLLARLPDLRCLVTTGSANRVVDLDAARRHGVVVSATGNGVGRVATAEATWGLVLALAKRIAVEERALRAGGWQTGVGSVLHGKTLGIAGLGGVGRHLARYGRAFGMDVVAWSPSLTAERAIESQARAVSFDELLATSDVLSLHVALNDDTRGLIGADALRAMRSTALLVNTSRGPVVDERALVEALRAGEIAGAAIDVFDREPLPADHPFRDRPDDLLLTPHIGYVADEVYATFFADTVAAVAAYLDGAPIRVLT